MVGQLIDMLHNILSLIEFTNLKNDFFVCVLASLSEFVTYENTKINPPRSIVMTP